MSECFIHRLVSSSLLWTERWEECSRFVQHLINSPKKWKFYHQLLTLTSFQWVFFILEKQLKRFSMKSVPPLKVLPKLWCLRNIHIEIVKEIH